MSMLSSQIDHLRELADALDGRYGYQGYEIAMRDAADTIWQLRDDLQRANAAVQDAEHDESMAWDRVRKVESENAKLRELVEDMFAFLDGADCARFPAGDVVITQAQISNFYDRMSDLGVEVDDG